LILSKLDFRTATIFKIISFTESVKFITLENVIGKLKRIDAREISPRFLLIAIVACLALSANV